MEFQAPSFSIIVSLFFFVFMLLKVLNRSKTNDSTSNLPPGPWKLPFMGNIHNLVTSQPHLALRDLARKHGPLMHLQLGEVSTVVVSSPEAARAVMQTHDIIFASRPQSLVSKIIFYDSADIVFSPCAEYWRKLRKICTLELLSAKCVQSFRSVREEEISNLITSITSHRGSPINLTEKVHLLIYGITSRASFGKKNEDQEAFISIIKECSTLAGGFNISDLYPSIKLLQLISGMKPKLERLQQKLDRLLAKIINDHKGRKATKTWEDEAYEDLVDVLLKYHDENVEFPLTIDNIKAVVMDVFSGGSESSATTVDWAMAEMLKNPSIMRKAQEEVRQVFKMEGNVDETKIHELEYLKAIIKETLRLHTPFPLLIPRESSQRCEINGYEIPVKTKVIINAWAMGRDPKFWTDADCFKPERFLDSSIDYKGNNFQFIPFGAGRRICPGISFGLANVELPLAQFLYHFDWKLPNGMKQEELDMTESFGISISRKEDLYVIPVAYQP